MEIKNHLLNNIFLFPTIVAPTMATSEIPEMKKEKRHLHLRSPPFFFLHCRWKNMNQADVVAHLPATLFESCKRTFWKTSVYGRSKCVSLLCYGQHHLGACVPA